MIRPLRIAGALLATVGLSSTLACADHANHLSGPDTPAPGKVQPVDYSIGGTVAGQIVSTTKRLSADGTPVQLLSADSTRYEAVIRTGGVTAAVVNYGDQSSKLVIAISNRNAQRQGKWIQASADGKLALHQSAENGGPVSVSEFVKDGVVLSRTETQWEKVAGGWQIDSRTTTLYQNGVPARELKTVYEAPARTSTGSDASKDDGTTVAAFEGGPCDAEMYAEEAALYLYWAADLGLGTCLVSVVGCFKAGLAFAAAVANVNAADKRLDLCVAKY